MNKAGLAKEAGRLAGKIAREAGKRAVVIAMEGPLGAGKTTFTKLLAIGLGIKDDIVSPTFVLHAPYLIQNLKVKGQNYNSKFKTLNHIDCYRMESFGELMRIGLPKMIEDKSVIAIEWADRFKTQITRLPSTPLGTGKSQAKLIWVKIDYGIKDNERMISYENIGN